MKISDQEIQDIRDLIKDGTAISYLLTNETVDAICEAALNARAELANARRARRDLFAAHAVAGFCARGERPDAAADFAYRAAEALLAELDKREAERAKDGSP